MWIATKLLIITLWCIFIFGILACQVFSPPPESGETQTPYSTTELQSLPPDFVNIQGQQIRQWAIEAEVSSEYADPEWAAMQATGPEQALEEGACARRAGPKPRTKQVCRATTRPARSAEQRW